MGYTAAWRRTMAPSLVASSITRDSSAIPAALSTERGMVSCPFLPIFASSMVDPPGCQITGDPAIRLRLSSGCPYTLVMASLTEPDLDLLEQYLDDPERSDV